MPEREGRQVCPHCDSDRVWRHGAFSRRDGSLVQRFRCRSCGRSFNPCTGTVEAYIKKRECWALSLQGMSSGDITLRQTAGQLGVNLSTAFRWRHRILAVLASLPKPVLDGFVSLGEYHVPYSEKGSRTPRGRGGGDTWWQVGPDGPRKASLAAKPGRPPVFRSFTHGRGSCILVAQSATNHVITIAGPGRLKVPALQDCLERMVDIGSVAQGESRSASSGWSGQGSTAASAVTEIFSFEHPFYYPEACNNLGLIYRSGWEERKRRERGEMAALERFYDRVRSGLSGWFAPFLGVATRYLHHYLAWYDAALKTDDISPLVVKVRTAKLISA